MTRDDLRGIVTGITDEQLKKILDINSSDIGKTKLDADGLKAELEEANKKVLDMETELGALKESQCEAEKMREKIDELQKVIDDRKVQDEKQMHDAAVKSRFDAVVGEAKFLNDFTKDGVFAQFQTAIAKEENCGRDDKELFGEIVGGGENLFVQQRGIPSVVASTAGFGGEFENGEIREIMGLPAQ